MSINLFIEEIVKYARSQGQIDPDLLRDGFEIMNFNRKIEQLSEESLAERGINLRLLEVLECLYHHPAGVMTPADLAEAVNLSRSAMTSTLDSLEKLGYATRSPHPVDRRMFEISLTENGRSFIEGILPDRYRKFVHIMEGISAEERAVVLRIYRKVYNLLKTELQS